MMKRYDSYKDSGVAWIGEIPKGWRILTNKYFIISKKNKSKLGDEELLSVSEYHGVIPRRKIRKGEEHLSRSETLEGYLKVKKGDLVSNIMLMWKRGLGVSEYNGIVSPSYSVFSFIDSEPKYFHYLFRTDQYVSGFRKNSKGIIDSRLRLYDDSFGSLKSHFPPLHEQHRIVAFLDAKTALIDALMEKTEQKIALLKEYRRALISEAVTKGLDPNVPMKDSGVAWIGKIPKGWKVCKLKHISGILPSNVDKHIYKDEIQVLLCNYTNVYYNEEISSRTETDLKKGSCSENEYNKFKLEQGDVIITKDSETPDDIGVPTYVKETLSNVVCGYHLTMIKPISVLGKFIFRFIQSDRARQYFEFNSNGITRFSLGKSSIENLFIPTPNELEQHRIVAYLDKRTQRIDKTLSAEEKRIALLKEYRRSLISEVVTGKRKVV